VGRVPADWWRSFFTGAALEVWRGVTSDDLTRSEADFLETALMMPPSSRALDVPCGSGRHAALELTARGRGSIATCVISPAGGVRRGPELLVATKREEETS
jgi:hypothetical protein